MGTTASPSHSPFPLPPPPSDAAKPSDGNAAPPLSFPPHSSPRIWLLTAATAPTAIAIARTLLAHSADCLVLGAPLGLLKPVTLEKKSTSGEDKDAQEDIKDEDERSGGEDGSGEEGGEEGMNDASEVVGQTSGREDQTGSKDSLRGQQGGEKQRKTNVRRMELDWGAVRRMDGIKGESERWAQFAAFWAEVCGVLVEGRSDAGSGDKDNIRTGWRERCRLVGLDGRCEFLFSSFPILSLLFDDECMREQRQEGMAAEAVDLSNKLRKGDRRDKEKGSSELADHIQLEKAATWDSARAPSPKLLPNLAV